MTLTIHDVEQGTDQWHDARRGVLTASAIGKLITPSTLKPARNETARQVILLLAAERITGHTDPTYPTREMERGNWDEPVARDLYSQHIAPVTECGFMVRDDWGYEIGFSPDGLVGDDGLVEIKSRSQKNQLATILTDQVPIEHMAQCQTGLIVSGRSFIDYCSYCSGMPLWTKRILPDIRWINAIVETAAQFEASVQRIINDYAPLVQGLPETIRVPELEEMRTPNGSH